MDSRMEDSGVDFPGFQVCVHKEEFEYRKALSRLQRRAPCPLQIKPNAILESQIAPQPIGCSINLSTSASSSPSVEASAFNSFYRSKDPIPLLSPLVSPSLLQSTCVQEGNTAKSH